ncbi:MAG: hypothetical protein J7621_01350 [Niastella sp.]|nr:hypothetical protein [Niastella sp.]
MKKLLIIALITGALAACGDNNSPDNINNDAPRDSMIDPISPDTSIMNTDTSNGRQNPNRNQDSLRYN